MGDLLTENRENERVGYVQFPLTQKTFSDFVRKLLGEYIRGKMFYFSSRQ